MLVVCIIRACSTHHKCFFIYCYTSSPPHSAYAWFLTRLLLHKNAIQWISYHWMVWFGSQSVSSLCPWEACSVLLPAVYLWAGLGPAFLIIHETSTGRKRSQHHAGSLFQPMVGIEKRTNLLWDYKIKIDGRNRKKIYKRQGIHTELCHYLCLVLFGFITELLEINKDCLWLACLCNFLGLIIEPPIINVFSI